MMPHPSQLRTCLVVLLLAAFALRCATGVWWQRSLTPGARFAFADSESYWVHAQRIVRGEPYQFGSDSTRVFRVPGYPVLLAGLFWLAGSDDPEVVWARILGAGLGTLTVGAVVLLGWQLFDGQVGLIAGGIAAVYPGAVAMSILVLAEAAFCPLMLLQLICWVGASFAKRKTTQCGLGLFGGIVAAAATLVRPSWLLFTPLAVAGAVVVNRSCRKQHLAIGTCMLVGFVVGMLPWWVRNYQVTGKFVPTTLQVGASLYDGLNPRANGASDMQFVNDFHQAQRQADLNSDQPLQSTFEYRLDRRMRDEAIHWAQTHPGRVSQLMGIKFLRIWNPWPNASELQSWSVRMVVMLGYVPLIVLGIWGAVRFTSLGWPYVLCFLPALYFTGLHMIFVSSIRYRQPAMLPLIVLGAAVIGNGSIWKLLGRDRGASESTG